MSGEIRRASAPIVQNNKNNTSLKLPIDSLAPHRRFSSFVTPVPENDLDDFDNLSRKTRSVSNVNSRKNSEVGGGRRGTIFTIGENDDFSDEDEFQRKLSSRRSSYSSNSSLESDIGESWRSRSSRRVSVIPSAMGLQPWVVGATTTSSSYRPSRKRKRYEDIKGLISGGKLNEAKGGVRDGDWDFTDDIRTRLWPFLASVHETKHMTGDYWDIVKEIFGHGRNEVPENAILLPGPCPPSSAIYYKLDERGISFCNRICSVLIYTYPDITHCIWLCPITALFLHYIDEEKTYACVGNLLKAHNKIFMTHTKLQAEASALVALTLTRKFSKSTCSTLVRLLNSNETLETVFHDWSAWIFRDLPFQHLVRVMDCFLMEGIKVLYRVTIGLLHHFAKEEKGSIGEAQLQTAISQHTKSIQLTPARLLKKAFSIRNFRSAEIKSVTVKTTFEMKTAKSMLKSKSTDSMPSSKSQIDLCNSSRTLNIKELYTVWQWLPTRITMYEPQLIFTTDEHGCSLSTFFNRVENYEPTLLIIKVTTGEIFGAYLSAAWVVRNEKGTGGERQRYFGTGESFLFSLVPKMIKYPWVGIKGKVEHAQELFMHADSNMISIGGGGGTGIQIDADLRYGKSERCLTFDNEPLVTGGDFEIQLIEVFAFSIV